MKQTELNALISNPQKMAREWDVEKLVEVLTIASDMYYNKGETILSDDIFDMLKDELERRAPSHPFLKQIGAPVDGEGKVKLPYWMGSLDKIRDDPKQLSKWKAAHPGSVVVSDKLDGNSAMLVFTKQGTRLYSRGNGEVGQDISHLLPFIQGVPTYATTAGIKDLAVRGELIISKNNWENIKHVGANARNVVAGALHRKQPDPSIASNIVFVAYELLSPRSMSLSEQLAFLDEHGFKVVFYQTVASEDVNIERLSSILMNRRANSPYEVDGIVIIQDTVHKLAKGKNPTYGFAYKSILTHDEAEVIVTQVEWNVSKDGYIKPTIHFAPVVLSGAKIQKVTAFNGHYIHKNNIGAGSRIVIIRSGDVIPHIVRVISASANGKPSMPELPFEWTESGVDIRITSETDEQKVRTLEHFAKTLDIPHVAIGTIRKLVEHGYDSIPKLLSITDADLLKIDGFQKTSASKIANALAHVRSNISCTKMMYSTNVFGRGLGKKKIDMIISAFPSILNEKLPSKAELCAVSGIGESTASSFLEGADKFFQMMKEMNISCSSSKTKPLQTSQLKSDKRKSLASLRILFTGFRNKTWEQSIEDQGGKVATSVSRNVDVVVANDPNEESSKLVKARELQITIISKKDFEMIYRV